MRLILSSKSPRRKELLALCGFDFDVIPADIDEYKITKEILNTSDPDKFSSLVMALARKKARCIYEKNRSSTVIGSDTIVVLDGAVYGKPQSESDARKMLTTMAGKVHYVYTGVAIISDKNEEVFYDLTEVRFHNLDSNMKTLIEDYIKSGDPFDKAGAYGIQGFGSLLVDYINGDYYSVMGLPISKVYRSLKENFI